MRVLVIEDEEKVASFIKRGFKEEGHIVDIADNGQDGLFLCENEIYDIAIVDLMLPVMDGLSVIKALRDNGNDMPVLILSALGEVDHRVKGLRSGGDDYLTKPFSFAELLARAEILAKRKQAARAPMPAHHDDTLTAQDVILKSHARKVTRGGKNIDLHATEFRMLEFLMRHKGQVVTRAMLIEQIWDYNFDPQANVIDVHISRLRAKIDKDTETPLITTVRSVGYIIEDT